MTTIVTEFGKFRYNRIPMGMCDLGYIFQAKVDELLGDTEGFKTYIYDILVLRKDFFKNHIEKPRIIFGILRAAVFKYNARKCSFWLKNIPYLRYVITRGGYKTLTKEVTGDHGSRDTNHYYRSTSACRCGSIL